MWDKIANHLCLGIFILILALIIWHTTNNFYGWLVLFIPGSIYIFRGLHGIIK
jgi:membrane-bound ClpP family serine protease